MVLHTLLLYIIISAQKPFTVYYIKAEIEKGLS